MIQSHALWPESLEWVGWGGGGFLVATMSNRNPICLELLWVELSWGLVLVIKKQHQNTRNKGSNVDKFRKLQPEQRVLIKKIMYLSFQVSSMDPPATLQQLPPPTSLVHTSVLLSLQHQSLKRTQTAKQSIFCMSMVRIFCFPYSHQTSEYVPLTYVINLFFYFFFSGAFFIYWVWGTNKFLVQ